MIAQTISKMLAAIVTITAFCNVRSANIAKSTLPSVPCPDLFRYESDGNKTFAVVTIKYAPISHVRTVIKFAIPGDFELANLGTVETTKFGHGECCYMETIPITYRVDFPPGTAVPQLFGISVNNVTLCAGPKGNPPISAYALVHDVTIVSVPKPKPSTERPSNDINETKPKPLITSESEMVKDTYSYSDETKPKPTITSEMVINSYSNCGQETRIQANDLAVYKLSINVTRYPWIVAIYERSDDALIFKCEGSLISGRTVISAAHCLENIPIVNLLLSMGRHNLNDWESAANIGVKKLIIHPDFRKQPITRDADVAIVHLLESVVFTPSIRPICLWQGPADDHAIDGTTGSIVGWGGDESVPKLVSAKIVRHWQCLRSNEQLFHLTSNRTICAGNRDGIGLCRGASGSALMIRNGTKWTLRGIFSATLINESGNCNLFEYSVFSDIAKFTDWVTSNMIA